MIQIVEGVVAGVALLKPPATGHLHHVRDVHVAVAVEVAEDAVAHRHEAVPQPGRDGLGLGVGELDVLQVQRALAVGLGREGDDGQSARSGRPGLLADAEGGEARQTRLVVNLRAQGRDLPPGAAQEIAQDHILHLDDAGVVAHLQLEGAQVLHVVYGDGDGEGLARQGGGDGGLNVDQRASCQGQPEVDVRRLLAAPHRHRRGIIGIGHVVVVLGNEEPTVIVSVDPIAPLGQAGDLVAALVVGLRLAHHLSSLDVLSLHLEGEERRDAVDRRLGEDAPGDGTAVGQGEVDVRCLLADLHLNRVGLLQGELVVVVLADEVHLGAAGVHPVGARGQLIHGVGAVVQGAGRGHHAVGLVVAHLDVHPAQRHVDRQEPRVFDDLPGDDAARRQGKVNIRGRLTLLHMDRIGLLLGRGVVVVLGQVVLLLGRGPHHVVSSPQATHAVTPVLLGTGLACEPSGLEFGHVDAHPAQGQARVLGGDGAGDDALGRIQDDDPHRHLVLIHSLPGFGGSGGVDLRSDAGHEVEDPRLVEAHVRLKISPLPMRAAQVKRLALLADGGRIRGVLAS